MIATHLRRTSRWGQEVVRYATETRSPLQFAQVLQIRLALSKVGSWVCPTPRTRSPRLRSLGGSVVLRSHTSDISVLNELVVSDGYATAARLLPSPGTIVDLGANTGLAARWFLQRWPSARVVSVEPEPGNIDILRQNLLGRAATVVPVAVGGSARSARLTTTNGEFAFTICGPEQADSTGGIDVEVVTMLQLLAAADVHRIGLLKADIEGAERELFADCASWIGLVDSLVVECHDGYSAAALLEDCRRGGADFDVLDLDRKPESGFEVVTAVRASARVDSPRPRDRDAQATQRGSVEMVTGLRAD